MQILTYVLERQLAEVQGAQGSTSLTREPTQPSQLLHSTSATEEESISPSPAGAATSSSVQSTAVSDTVKGE